MNCVGEVENTFGLMLCCFLLIKTEVNGKNMSNEQHVVDNGLPSINNYCGMDWLAITGGSRPLNKASIGKHANSPLENQCFLPKWTIFINSH